MVLLVLFLSFSTINVGKCSGFAKIDIQRGIKKRATNKCPLSTCNSILLINSVIVKCSLSPQNWAHRQRFPKPRHT